MGSVGRVMVFSSIVFLYVFLPLAIFGFFAVAALRRRNLTLAYIIAASLVFYGYFDYRYIFLLLVSAAVNYALSVPIFSECGTKKGKLLAGLGVLFNIALMGYFELSPESGRRKKARLRDF